MSVILCNNAKEKIPLVVRLLCRATLRRRVDSNELQGQIIICLKIIGSRNM